MAKKKTVVPFNGTKEQEAQLAAVIEKYKDVQGALMPVAAAGILVRFP